MQMVERRESIATSCQNVRGCGHEKKSTYVLTPYALGPTIPSTSITSSRERARRVVFSKITYQYCNFDPRLRCTGLVLHCADSYNGGGRGTGSLQCRPGGKHQHV